MVWTPQSPSFGLGTIESNAAQAEHLESSGYPLIQGFKLPIAGIGNFDTRPAIGVVTEIIGSTTEGHEFRRNLKADNF